MATAIVIDFSEVARSERVEGATSEKLQIMTAAKLNPCNDGGVSRRLHADGAVQL